jgi:hypothetical protein
MRVFASQRPGLEVNEDLKLISAMDIEISRIISGEDSFLWPGGVGGFPFSQPRRQIQHEFGAYGDDPY